MKLGKFKRALVAAWGIAALSACGGADDAGSADAGDTAMATEPMIEAPDYVGMPDWMPGNIYLPDDFTVTGSREIGTRNFLLDGTSAMSQEELLSTYRSQLEAAGYDVTPLDRMPPGEPTVQFKGNGLEAAGVAVSDTGDMREIRINFARDM